MTTKQIRNRLTEIENIYGGKCPVYWNAIDKCFKIRLNRRLLEVTQAEAEDFLKLWCFARLSAMLIPNEWEAFKQYFSPLN